MSESCDTCRFLEAMTEIKGKVFDGLCRRYAPRPLSILPRDIPPEPESQDGGFPQADWPRVSTTDWCGEYQAEEDAAMLDQEWPVLTAVVSTRLQNAARANHVHTLRQLLEQRPADVLAWRNVGVACMAELEALQARWRRR